MTRIDFYLDFASPYAWLAFDELPRALEGVSYAVSYRPIVLGAVFQHHGHAGPVAVAPKHAWIRRHTEWLAQRMGLPLQWPAQHPFTSLPLLRLAWACARQGTPNRYVCQQIFEHVWAGGGAAADDQQRLEALVRTLTPALARDPASAEVKQKLRVATSEAVAQGVFGVPGFVHGGQVFWGLDALPMLREHVLNPAQAADGMR